MLARIASKTGLGQNSLFLTISLDENKEKEYLWCSLRTGELYNTEKFASEEEALHAICDNTDLEVELYDEYVMTYDASKVKTINDFYPDKDNTDE